NQFKNHAPAIGKCHKSRLYPTHKRGVVTVMGRQKGLWLQRGVALAALTALALPPALAAMSRADRIQKTQLSSALLGQFTPAAG
ncbi:hypothetical protein ACI3PL_27500, partial [Lacticaseibacillus paracasei]